MKKRLLAITGVFMPYNDTITQITYKHLCNLDYNIDVVAFTSKKDESIINELEKDENYKKFNMKYINKDFDSVNFSKKNLNIFKIILCIRKLYKKSKELSKKQKYDVLYSNSMPNYTHFAAYLVKKRLGSNIKWYASFSDPIINNPYINVLKRKNIILYLLQKTIFYKNKYQNYALKYADKLIFMSEELRDFVIGSNKDLLSKSIVIPITYIESWDSYKTLIEYKPKFEKKIINFMHFGNIYGLREIELFLIALKQLKLENKDVMKNVIIHQYGNIEPRKRALIKKYDVDDIFIVHERVDYHTCLNLMKEKASVLVIFDTILPDNKIQPFLPSKILEYLLARKPIYAVTSKKSPTYRILNKDHICTNYSIDSIKKTLLKQIQNIKPIENNYKNYENKFVIKRELKKELNVDK